MKQFQEITAEATGSDQEISEEDEYMYHSITIDSIKRTEAFAKIQFTMPEVDSGKERKRSILAKVDTGAQGNTLPLRIYKLLRPDDMGPDNKPSPKTQASARGIVLKAYNGSTIQCHGKTSLQCRGTDKRWSTHLFFLVDVPGPAIIGLPAAETLKLVTMHCSIMTDQPHDTDKTTKACMRTTTDLIRLYPDQFDKIGNLPGEARLHLKEEAVPFIDPPRKFPIHTKETIQKELDKMCAMGVIRPVREHSDWCSSLTTATKADGTLRICLDPRNLNKGLRRCPHKMKTTEEVTHLFHGAQYFSKLDAYKGYWSVELHKDDQLLTTFRTPSGRYCFQRLPFGLCVSQDLFQQRIDSVIEHCPGVAAIADDIVVYGRTESEHDQNLLSLMEAASRAGLTFNSTKCKIRQREIKFFGQMYTNRGVYPDPQKIEDLHAMPSPVNKTEVQQFLGAIGYLSPFIQGLSAAAEPIRKLTAKDVPFEWSEDYEHVFQEMKKLITKESNLKYYDTTAPTYLMVDASQKGLGAALLQPDRQAKGYSDDLRPVAFASKALTSGEQKLYNIEREMLAVRFGVRRFHTYLYNRPFIVLSDHRPLSMISKKPLHNAPPRLQSLLLDIQGYDYQIKYIPGTEVGIADALSRLPNPAKKEDLYPDVKFALLRFSEAKVLSLQGET